MKKRAALCFSGQLRNVEAGFSYIDKNMIQPNLNDWEFDSFVHTWFDKEDIGKPYITAKGIAVNNNETGCNTIPENILGLVYQFYNPKKLLVEKQIDFDEKDYASHKSAYIIPKFSLSKMNSTLRVQQLKTEYESQNDFQYDLVVSLRFDLGIQNQINLNDFDKDYYNCSTHGVYMGIGVDVTHGIMGTEIFDDYASLFSDVENIWKEHNVEFADERLTHKHLDLLNIKINRTHKLNDYFLIRS